MTVVSMLAALLCIYGFCSLLVNKAEISASAAPITVLCASMVWFSVVGMAGFLRVGGWLYFAAGLAVLVWQIVKNRDGAFRLWKEPSFLLFFGCSFFLVALFAVQKPMFYQWDEFTFWGSAAKVTFESGQLYPTVNSNMVTTAYPPALPLLVYWFQFFGTQFAEWVGYAAYDILAVACVASLCHKQRNSGCPIFLGVTGLLLPLFFELGASTGIASTVYLNLQADVTLGLLFGAALAVYYASQKRKQDIAVVWVILAALSLVKDMGLALGLIAAGIMAVDFLCCETALPLSKRLPISAAVFGALAAVVVVGWWGWSKYVGIVSGENRFDLGNTGESHSLGMGEMLVQGVKELLGIGTTEQFSQMGKAMLQAYWQRKICLLGSGLVVTVVIMALLAVAFIAGDKKHKKRVVLYTVFSTGGFLAFWVFHWFLYLYVFKSLEGEQLKDYSRYFSEYYLGWLVGAMVLLAISQKSKLVDYVSAVFLCGIGGAIALRGQTVNNFMNYSNTFYQERLHVKQRAQQVNELVSPEDRIYPILQTNDGTRWYYYGYELESTLLKMYGGGDGSKENPYQPTTAATLTDGQQLGLQRYEVTAKQQDLVNYLKETQATVLLVDRADDYTAQLLQPYTQGTMDNSGLLGISLYSIDWEDTLVLTPIESEVNQ